MIPALLAVTILISAGHEGRPESCARFPQHTCNLGAAGERAWTPIVADAATRVLREHGVTVIRKPADFAGQYAVDAAIFIHFDGSATPCGSGASVGFHHAADAPAAALWHRLYGARFPFGFEPDNFTKGLRDYYAYKQIDAKDGSLLLELGEVTCPAQRAWLASRLQWEGALIAYFAGELTGIDTIPLPE